jgi:hypothetical protein
MEHVAPIIWSMFAVCLRVCKLQPLLIENIEEELDPVLDPVLERRLVKKGKSWVLQLADKEVRRDMCA